MATIPTGQKFHTLANFVNTTERGSGHVNDRSAVYTMQDIIDTVNVSAAGATGTAGTVAIFNNNGDLASSTLASDNGSTFSIATMSLNALLVTETALITSLSIPLAATGPTSASTAGIAGNMVITATNIYICTTTGAAGSAIWKETTLTLV